MVLVVVSLRLLFRDHLRFGGGDEGHLVVEMVVISKPIKVQRFLSVWLLG